MKTITFTNIVALFCVVLICTHAWAADDAPMAGRLIVMAQRYRDLGNIKASETKLDQAARLLREGDVTQRTLQCRLWILRAENALDSGLLDAASAAIESAYAIQSVLSDVDRQPMELQLIVLRCRLLAARGGSDAASRVAHEFLDSQNQRPRHIRALQIAELSAFLSPSEGRLLLDEAANDVIRLHRQGIVSTNHAISQLQVLAQAQTDLQLHADAKATNEFAITICHQDEGTFVRQLASIYLTRAIHYSKLIQSADHAITATATQRAMAIADLNRVVELSEKHASNWPTAWYTASLALHELGSLHQHAGDTMNSLNCFYRAAALFPEKRLADDDLLFKEVTRAAVQELRVSTLHRGRKLVRLLDGQASESYEAAFSSKHLIEAATQLVETYNTHRLDTDEQRVLMLLSLAGLLAEDNQLEEAYSQLKQVAPHIDVFRNSHPRLVAGVRMLLGEVRLVQPQPEVLSAKQDLQSAIDISNELTQVDILRWRGVLGLARIDSLSGFYADAITQFTKIIEFKSKGLTSNDPNGGEPQRQLKLQSRLLRGLVYRDLGRSDLALLDYRRIEADKSIVLRNDDRFSLKLAQTESLIARGSDDDLKMIAQRIDEMEAMLKQSPHSIAPGPVIELRHQQARVW